MAGWQAASPMLVHLRPLVSSSPPMPTHPAPNRALLSTKAHAWRRGTSGHCPEHTWAWQDHRRGRCPAHRAPGAGGRLDGLQDGALDGTLPPHWPLSAVATQAAEMWALPLPTCVDLSLGFHPCISQGSMKRPCGWQTSSPHVPPETSVLSEAKAPDSLQLPVANPPPEVPDQPSGHPEGHLQGRQPWLIPAGFRRLVEMVSSRGQRVSVTAPQAASTRVQAPPGLCPVALVMDPHREASPMLGPASPSLGSQGPGSLATLASSSPPQPSPPPQAGTAPAGPSQV